MTTDEEIKAMVKRLIGAGGDLDLLAVGALQALAARAVAAEKRLAEVELERDAANYAHARMRDRTHTAEAHRDRLVSALRALCTAYAACNGEDHPAYNAARNALSGTSDPRKDVARRCVELVQGWAEVVGAAKGSSIHSALYDAANLIYREFSLDTKGGADV